MAYTAVGMKTIIPDTPKAAMLPSACESSAKGYPVTSPHVARQTINWLIAGRRNPKLYYVREIPKV